MPVSNQKEDFLAAAMECMWQEQVFSDQDRAALKNIMTTGTIAVPTAILENKPIGVYVHATET